VSGEPIVIGVDVGGTKVAAGALEGAVIGERVEHPTDLSGADALLAEIEAAVREVAARVGAPAAVGVGMPSQIEYETGTVVASVNIPLAGMPLRQELGRRLGTEVLIDNDANCAALAEAHAIDGGPARHLVMLTLGTGVGGGVVIDGRIFRGATGLGAELGHVPIDLSRRDEVQEAGKGARPGSIEYLCSGTALEREANRLAAERPGSALADAMARDGHVSGRDAVEAARAGDDAALELMEEHARRLGAAIGGFVNVFEPEHVVVGGGLSAAADLFLERAAAEAAHWALPALWERVAVSVARAGNDAGMIGAALTAAQELAATGDTGRARETVDEGAR
jgi:glucokinase